MVRIARRAVFLLVFSLAPSSSAIAQLASLAADVNRTITQPRSSEPRDFTRVGSRLLFAARPSANEPEELWSTDGEVSGTERLAPGIQYQGTSGVVEGKLVWIGYQPDQGVRVYVSGGTASSTVALTPPLFGLEVGAIRVVGNRAYLFHYSPEGVLSLWRTDGLAGTIELVAELGGRLTPACSSYFERPTRRVGDLVVSGDRLAFRIHEVDVDRCEDTHAELWYSDGTAAGTRRVRRFDSPRRPSALVAAGDRVFLVSDEGGRLRLWASDGSPNGTRPLFDLTSGVTSPFTPLWSDGSRLLFPFDDGVHGLELWSVPSGRSAPKRLTDLPTDVIFPSGTENPTLRLGEKLLVPASTTALAGHLWVVTAEDPGTTRPLDSGCLGQCGADPMYLPGPVRLGPESAFFFGDDGTHGLEPWVTDGTDAGTRLIRDVCPGECAGAGYVVLEFPFPVFTGFDPVRGSELWTTDGTESGTRPVTDLVVAEPFGALYGDRPVGRIGARLIFSAWDPQRGFEPWISEGEPPWTRLLTDLAPGASSDGDPFAGVAMGDELLFLVCEGDRQVLAVTIPEAPGFRTLASEGSCNFPGSGSVEGRRGSPARSPAGSFAPDNAISETQVAVVDDTGFFAGRDLWRTDGTAAGTERLTDLSESTAAGIVTGIVPWEGRVIFGYCGEAGLCHPELWSADPESSEISLLVAPQGVRGIGDLTTVGDRLFFTALDDQGWEIWTSDGTPAGTLRLTARARPDYPLLDPAFTAVEDEVYFRVDASVFEDLLLWHTDGTPAGTSPVPLHSVPGTEPTAMIAFDGALYFVRRGYEENPASVWRTDGTAPGTRRIADLGSQTATDVSPGLLPNGFVFLTVGFDRETLWISDGTSGGTRPLETFGPYSLPQSDPLLSTGSRIYFRVCEETYGCELWSSDGTPGEARPVHDLAPGPESSFPGNLVRTESRLFFAADDGLFGRELWMIPLDAEPGTCTPNELQICIADRFRAELVWSPDGATLRHARPLPLRPFAATFSFSPRDVPDGVLKILDGSGLNDHHWLFYGGLSDRSAVLTVADAASGLSRRYRNPEGAISSFRDIHAFAEPPEDPGALVTEAEFLPASPPSPCDASPHALCLHGGRFAITLDRDDPADGASLPAAPTVLGSEHGLFHFYRSENPELAVKILDARNVDGHYWLFVGSLTDRAFTLTVVDLERNVTRSYRNPAGTARSFVDGGW